MKTSEPKTAEAKEPCAALRDLLDYLDSTKASPAQEGRRSRRLKYRTSRLLVQVLNHRQEIQSSFQVSTRNISAHGLGFLHKRMFATGQQLRIEIPLLDDQTVTMLARVVRCRYVRDMTHEIGVEFLGTTRRQD